MSALKACDDWPSRRVSAGLLIVTLPERRCWRMAGPSDRRGSPGAGIEPAWIALTLAPQRALPILSKNYIEAYRRCKLEALVVVG
jgi:hypothetical protein